jgi:hypothetical protein
MYFEILPAQLGLVNVAFDHPHLGVSEGCLYLTAYTSSIGSQTIGGFVIIRIGISQLRTLQAKQITFQYVVFSTREITMLSYPPEQSGSRAFWLAHLPQRDGAIVYWWDDNSAQLHARRIAIPAFEAAGNFVSLTDGGANWLDSCFTRICGAAVVDFNYPGQPREVYFAWGSNVDRTFTQPHIYVLALEQDRATDEITVTGTRRIWNRRFAWAHPALAIGGQRKLAMVCACGGGALPHVSFQAGYLQWPLKENSQYECWTIAESDRGEARWGDYIKVRDISPSVFRGLFAATGYVLKTKRAVGRYSIPGQPTSAMLPFVEPHYLVFGDAEP